MKISFICPGRNNLKYAKWSYDSIQKNKGNHEVEYCFADDASTDGTKEWCEEMSKKDSNFKYIVNDTGERVGHTILYDRLVNEVATHDMCMIYHCDMYLCPGALDAIEKHMYSKLSLKERIEMSTFWHKDEVTKQLEDSTTGTTEKYVLNKLEKQGIPTHNPTQKTIVSLTRIEPPLHPDGPEKVLLDCGVEPEEFDEAKLLEEVMWAQEGRGFGEDMPNTTEGIFAPWAFWKKDFQEIGGHDPLYRPQSKEDSDIFNRFQLNGCKFVQTWEGFVYHMTCRGSRRNTVDKAKNIYEDSPEWLEQNAKSTRNFIRKWGSFVKHDTYMKPIIPNKYDIGIVITNCNLMTLTALEPYANNVYIDDYFIHYPEYIKREQPNTDYDLSERILPYDNEKNNNIIIEMDANKVGPQEGQYLQMLAEIFDQGVEPGTFELGQLKITVVKPTHYTKDLIKIDTQYNK